MMCAQVLQESLLVLREVEGLIKDALGLGAHDPLDIAHPSNLARIPKALLDAMQASTPPCVSSGTPLWRRSRCRPWSHATAFGGPCRTVLNRFEPV